MEEFRKEELNKVKRGPKRAVYNIAEINAILDAGFIAFVSYNYNGRAISLPMAYGRIEDKLYFHGSRKNRMLLALLAHKEMSVTVMHLDALVLARSAFHHSVNYRSATLFGSARSVEELDLKEKSMEIMVNNMLPGRWKHLRAITEKEINSTLVLEMTIETASAKIRDEGVVDEKSDSELDVWAGLIPIKQVAEAPISDAYLSENVKVPEHVVSYYQQHKK